jgi:DNA-binding Lrp family transcriptional regulator
MVRSRKAGGAAKTAKGLSLFVLVQTVPGRVKTIVQSMRRIPAVKNVHPVTGPYDIVAFLEVSRPQEIAHVVAGTIGGMRGVTRTTTLLCTE